MLSKIDSKFLLIKTGSINTNNAETMLLNLSGKSNPTICLISLKPITSNEHIKSAFYHSLKAFENNSNTTKNIQLELLLFLTARKQLDKALDEMELNGKDEIALIGFGANKKIIEKEFKILEKELNFKENKNLIQKNLKKNFNYFKKFFSITEKELSIIQSKNKFEALQKSVLERIALTKIGER
ncbi:MAG: KEOPS complex subunit Cgi121 [archaeon]|nr:KEOPS complex subunit Cgi121 [archaeon]